MDQVEVTQRFDRCGACGGLVDHGAQTCPRCGKSTLADVEQTMVMPVVASGPGGAAAAPPAGAPVYLAPPATLAPRSSALPLVAVLSLAGLAALLIAVLAMRIDWSGLRELGPPRGSTPMAGAATTSGIVIPGIGSAPTIAPPSKPGQSTAIGAVVPGGPTTAAATPSLSGGVWLVGNTGSDGVYIRRTPRLSDRIVAWPDGATMQDLGEEVTGNGLTWRKVRDPAGNVGYIPSQWLVPGR